MTVYIILIIISLLPLISKHHIPRGYYYAQCLIFIMVAGLRNHVGGDTLGYMQDWESYPTIDNLNIIHFVIFRYQPGWIILNCLCKTFSPEFYILQIVISTFINISIFYIIQKYSPNKYFSVLIYLLLYYCYFNFEILRESIAVCIFLFAFEKFYNKQWIKYYLLLIVGFLFHDGIFLFSILPFLHKFIVSDITIKKYIIISVIAIVFFNPIILSKFMFLLPGDRDENFMTGYGSMEIGSVAGLIRAIITIGIYIIISISSNLKNNKFILSALFIFISLQIFGVFMPIFSIRISNYFKIYYSIAITIFLYGNRDYICKYALILLLCFSFYKTYFEDVTQWTTLIASTSTTRYYFYERYVPYYSIFEIPDNSVIAKRKDIYHSQYNHGN